MKIFLKTCIIRILLRLQFQPFLFLFRAYYRLAISTSVRVLRRFEGVESIYLAGSLAGGRVLYGISDIDFVIFMQGRETDEVRTRIDGLFSRLRRIFPVLGADRKTVFFQDSFAEKYADFPILQQLFDSDFHRYSLLFGKDRISDLPQRDPSDESRRLACLWKMKYWMEKIILILCSDRLTGIQKRYSVFKAMDDLAKIHLSRRGEIGVFPEQGRSLRKMVACFDSGQSDRIERLLREREERFLRPGMDVNELFDLFKAMISQVAGSLRSGEDPDGEGVEGVNFERVEDRTAGAIRGCLAADFTLRRIPAPPVSVNVADCRTFGCPAYLLIPERSLGVEDLRRLKRFHEERMSNRGMVFVQDHPHFFYAVDSEMMEHWLHAPGTEEHVVKGLAGSSDLARLTPAYAGLLKRKLDRNLAQIRGIFEEDAVDLLETSMHAKLVFTSFQRMIALRELGRGRFFIPGDSREVIDYLVRNTPVRKGLLEKISEEYTLAVQGGGTGMNGYFKKLHALLRDFRCALENGEPLDRLSAVNDMPDRERLSVSVVIITRNRSAMLERCLDALLAMGRSPEEILVVDNASTDSTRDVVMRFQAAGPVRYVHEPVPGVSRARNAGCRAASGDIIAFIDDDAIPTEGWLENIENAFVKSDSIGIVGGAIHHYQNDREDMISRYYRLQEGEMAC